MKYTIILLGIIAFILLWLSQRERLIQFNASQCAVYGKMPDCKTPLK